MVKGFFERLRRQVTTSDDSPEGLMLEGTPEPVAVLVLIADLDGRGGREIAAQLGESLISCPGIAVQLARKRLKMANDSGLVKKLAAAGAIGRTWLDQEGADVLIWGEIISKNGAAVIHFLPSAPDAEGKTGTFGLGDNLELPAAFGSEFGDIAAAAALAAAGAVNGDGEEVLSRSLSAATGRISGYVEASPTGLTPSQSIAMLTCIGNCFAALWRINGDDAHLDRAVRIYNLALESCSRVQMPISYALIQNHLAAAFEVQAARGKDPVPLELATKAYQAVTEVLDRGKHPQDWAFAQNRLGMTCYRLALRRDNDARQFKASIKALEAARLVFTRDDATDRWAEITNQLGIVLMALGIQVAGTEALERSVAAFHETLEVRQENASPLLWAQTANNLGAASFALYRRKETPELLEEAMQRFEGAREIYAKFGHYRTVEIIEKNLDRARRSKGRRR